MITLLSRLFIKDRENTASVAVRLAYGTLCGILGIFLNLLLFAAKLLVGLFTGAISVMADALNNLTDAGSSVVSLIGFRLSGQKPDKHHPFGHGRIEYLSGLFISMLILLVGFELAKSSVEKILFPVPVGFYLWAALILSASVLIKGYMAFYNLRLGKRLSSPAMRATGFDSLSDAVATATVLLCLCLSTVTALPLDAYCGLLVSLFILYSGLRSAKETVSPLLGEPPSPELIERILRIVYSHGEVAGIHDLIVHNYGPGRSMLSLHAEVRADADLLETHDMIDNIERELSRELSCDAVIHMDPIVTDDEEVVAIRQALLLRLTAIDGRLTMHDFRMVKGPTHTNLIFDVVLPYDMTESEDALRERIEAMAKELSPTYFTVVSFDKSYT
ncbi:MAG: cation transporter [Clostridia bacterium]|nr:cation transporter [Clostridia bacterium]